METPRAAGYTRVTRVTKGNNNRHAMGSSVLLAHSGSAEIRSTVLPTTVLVHYNYEFATLNHIREKLLQSTARSPVKQLGLHLQHNENSQLSLSGVEKMIISKYSLQKETPVRQFFRTFISDRCPIEGVFIDIFLTAPIPDAEELEQIFKTLTRKKITVRFVHRFLSDEAASSSKKVLQIYFNLEKLLRLKTNPGNATAKSKLPSATNRYERIRVAGKGAFGMAVLYKRKEDDSLVIIKEIRIHEMSSNERQLALNEVTLLSQLDHPSIISYFDSFEEDGVLMIEMEYAEGGTLAQLLTRRETFVEEEEIMRLFEQITNAVAYLHDNSVLHRDLKTANIFLTKFNDVKVGDFGISKIMSAETVVQGAQTVVGTPFYISPEMCEGKPYNEKSDIWALGCILYEMACLQKTFDGTNLPAVVNKIMKAEYNPVKGPYSNKLKVLIREMLKTDPLQRPTAKELLEGIQKGRKISFSYTKDSDVRFANSRSSLYHMDIVNMVLVPEPSLPPKIKVKQIEFSLTHTLMLSADNMVYSWGDNKCGQLGLGDRRSRGSPTIIEVLSGKGISKIAAGNQFSVFCITKGVVLVCGQRRYLGNGEKGEDCLKPKVIDSLLRVDITDVACGGEHAVAVDTEGRVYVWGSAENGRLGTGDEAFVFTAVEIPTIPIGQSIMNVRCGHDCTALLTTSGIMLAMGSNKFNKLNLNARQGFFADKKDVTDDFDDILTPRAVKPFPSRIVDVKLGTFHSGVLLESGHIHLFGRNSVGELGMGHRNRYAPWNIYNPVKALLNKTCLLLECGDGFSMAATSDNKLFFWGSKSAEQQTNTYVEDLENSFGTFDDKKTLVPRTQRFNWTNRSCSFEDNSSNLGSIILQPSLVLRLDSTPDSDGSRVLIRLSSLCCIGKNVIVVIDTVSPSRKIEQPTRKPERRRSAPASSLAPDSTVVEPWIQEELEEADQWAHTRNKPSASTEKRLMKEIEALKKKLNNHESTCKNHAEEMNHLQAKIAHLNSVQQEMAIQSVPPPAYDAPPARKEGRKKSTLINTLIRPDSSSSTRVCVVM